MEGWLQHSLLTDVAGNILVHRPTFIVETVLTQGMTEVKTRWKNVKIQTVVQVYGGTCCERGWSDVSHVLSKCWFKVFFPLSPSFSVRWVCGWCLPPGCKTGCEQQGCDLNPGAPTPRPSFQPCSVSPFVCRQWRVSTENKILCPRSERRLVPMGF